MPEKFISVKNLINEYKNEIGIREEFKSLYDYLLYTCGGDFNLFNFDGLEEFLVENKILTREEIENLKITLKNQQDKIPLYLLSYLKESSKL
jgi:NADH dehydrogenase FAD-containing subunit